MSYIRHYDKDSRLVKGNYAAPASRIRLAKESEVTLH